MSMTREELDKWGAELECKRECFARIGKKFEDLTAEERAELERLEREVEVFNSEMFCKDVAESPADSALSFDELYENEQKSFYYKWCMLGKQSIERVQCIVEDIISDSSINKKIERIVSESKVLGDIEKVCKNLEDTKDEYLKKIVREISFADKWVTSKCPFYHNYDAIFGWVDEYDFKKFIEYSVIVSKLESAKKIYLDEEDVNKINAYVREEFDFERFVGKDYIVEILKEVSIIDSRGMYLLGDRGKSGFLGFIDACIDKNILPSGIPKYAIVKSVANFIGMPIKRHLEPGTRKYKAYYDLTTIVLERMNKK